jgi:hypothetical protein
MPITPRDASKALLVSLCALPVLLLAGCGGTDAATSDPGPASATSAAPSPTSPTSPTSKAPATSKASDGPAPVHYAGDTKLVTLPAYRLSYRVPAGWITVNGKDLLRRDNPVLTTVAARTGMTIDQLISSLGSHLQAYSISDKGAVDGILDNVNAIGFPAGGLTDAQMRAQFAAIGARPGLARPDSCGTGRPPGVRLAHQRPDRPWGRPRHRPRGIDGVGHRDLPRRRQRQHPRRPRSAVSRPGGLTGPLPARRGPPTR